MSHYIDIGVNLTSGLFTDIPAVLKNSWDWQVDRLILTGTTFSNSKQSYEMIAKYKDTHPVKLYSTVGVHPHQASTWRQESEAYLTRLFLTPQGNVKPGIVAVGECGLDYNRMHSPKEIQLQAFEAQVTISEKLKLPLFLHERDAIDDFLAVMDRHPNVKGVVHCFMGDRDTVRKYLDRGLYIGVTGGICRKPRNRDLLAALKSIPLNRIMVETDAPYMDPFGNKVNWPSNVYYVVEKIANELKLEESGLAKQVYGNTVEFFGLPA